MTRNLAHRLSASIYELLDSNDFKIDAPADTITKCTEWMPCTYIGNHWSCSQNKIQIVTMNIIHSDTDDNKVSVCAGVQSCLPCLSNVYIIYSLIQSNQPFYLCWVILSGVSFWHGLPFYRIHTNALTGVAISLQALIWHFDMSHKILLFVCSHLWNHLFVTSHNDHRAEDLSFESCSKLLLTCWSHALSLNKWCIGHWARNLISIW